jgi:two-component system KDP operon response regulator KdpE
LLAAIRDGSSVEQTGHPRVFISQLRKKIEPESVAPRYILTENWIGYRFDPGA